MAYLFVCQAFEEGLEVGTRNLFRGISIKGLTVSLNLDGQSEDLAGCEHGCLSFPSPTPYG